MATALRTGVPPGRPRAVVTGQGAAPPEIAWRSPPGPAWSRSTGRHGPRGAVRGRRSGRQAPARTRSTVRSGWVWSSSSGPIEKHANASANCSAAPGAAEQFAEAFAYFSIGPDEDDQTGHYGPYSQSARAQTYLTYVRELLRQGRAYPCFATKQDLEEITARQRAAGALPGYYGTWAIWRDADPEEVAKRLAAGDPYVVRFRSPGVAGAG